MVSVLAATGVLMLSACQVPNHVPVKVSGTILTASGQGVQIGITSNVELCFELTLSEGYSSGCMPFSSDENGKYVIFSTFNIRNGGNEVSVSRIVPKLRFNNYVVKRQNYIDADTLEVQGQVSSMVLGEDQITLGTEFVVSKKAVIIIGGGEYHYPPVQQTQQNIINNNNVITIPAR